MAKTPSPISATVKFLIREASFDDVVRLAQLFRQEVEFHQRLAGYYELLPSFDWNAFVRSRLGKPERTIFIAYGGGRLIGFISVRISRYSEPPKKSLLKWLLRRNSPQPGLPIKPFSWGVIEDCFVAEPFRRRGIGRALVSKEQEWFKDKGIGRLELGVLPNNPDAEQFWETLGFRTFRLLMQRDIQGFNE